MTTAPSKSPTNAQTPWPSEVQPTIALVGNPNAGKTTLFNQLTGLRAKTANFPGTTYEYRLARLRVGAHAVSLLDLPGAYTLSPITAEERHVAEALRGDLTDQEAPDVIVVVLDATHLERGLFLVSQVMEIGRPTVIALNMSDLADKTGIDIDRQRLSEQLGLPVVPVAARSGKGVDELRWQMARILDDPGAAAVPRAPEMLHDGCAQHMRYEWAEQVVTDCVRKPVMTTGTTTEKFDRFLTHPVVGVLCFFAVMLAVFYMIFSLATIPMDLIDGWFGSLAAWTARTLPPGAINDLVSTGIVGGVGSVLVFLPQIVILFFFIALLEDTGYLARAAFVMDRLLRRVGLPGQAFVPMLSAHACAIPAIMSTKVIEDRRDRLVTILVLPLLTCSARLPVYAMIALLLFAAEPLLGALLFTGAYALGLVAALGVAFALKRSLLPGESKPLILELPSYKVPSLRTALYTVYDRTIIFLKNAGTTILLIMIVLWWLSSYPKLDEAELRPAIAAEVQAIDQEMSQLESLAAADDGAVAELEGQRDNLLAREQLRHSFAGQLGRTIEPVLEPLGFNWQIGIGVVTSFAARETVVGTLGVIYGVGEEAVDDPEPLLDRIRQAKHPDGTPVFTMATSISLLVFYVLAMQCLPTQAVTMRETNSWKWPIFQLGYMTALAYLASLVAYQGLNLVGIA